MKAFKRTLLAASVMLSVSSAFAAPTFPFFLPGVNNINFDAYENQYRLTALCASTSVNGFTSGTTTNQRVTNQTACMNHNAVTDPVGYSRVSPYATGANAINGGDIFAGVFRVNSINPGGIANQSGPAAQFTGYFAQQVVGAVPLSGSNLAVQFAAPAVDPFGILSGAAGAKPDEMFKLYTQAPGVFDPNNGATAASQIASATLGTYWGSLGVGADNGYAYAKTDTSVPGATDSNTTIFLALDFILPNGPSYNAGKLNKVNDLDEFDFGNDTATGSFECSPTDIATSGVACTDIAGRLLSGKNPNFGPTGAGKSPFFYQAGRPLAISVIPEPGSLALMGLALAGLGLVRRRKVA